MTREEAYNRIDAIIAKHEIDDEYVTITSIIDYDALRLARKLLEQEPKTGHWIRCLIRNEKGGCIGAKMICSECGNDNKHDEYMIYCPNCGEKMVEPQERSSKT